MRSTTTLRLFAATAALTVAFPAFAAQSDDVTRLQVRGDLYIAGGMVNVVERVDGDLIAAGGTVTVEGGIAGDLLVAGGQVEVMSVVKDDLRIAGGKVRVRGPIGGDLVIFGGEVTVDPSVTIGGNAVIMGGDVAMEGTVGGDLRIDAEESIVAGGVKGSVNLRGGKVQLRSRVLGNATLVVDEFQASPQARIEGKTDYWFSDGPQNFGTVAGGTATYRPEWEPVFDVERPAASGLGLGLLGLSLWGLLSGALFILIVMLLTRTYFIQAGKLLRKRPGKCVWHGFLTLALIPILGVLFCITLIGLPIGFFLFFYYVFLLIFLKPIAALVLARTLEDYWKQKWSFWLAFVWTLAVYVVLKLLMIIPVVGWIAVVLLCMAGLGADMIVKWDRFKKTR